MIRKPIVEQLTYALVIICSLAALALVAAALTLFSSAKLVYQGF